ncbi:MAG: amino acid adenylation domain-containing protein [Lachnospiraceae bacterium]|nr:amino acid adenylation domain-containing protein [Lachnospiraceae bacterium]
MKSVLEYLEISTKKYPQKIIFFDERKDITYQDFFDNVKRIASRINDIVGDTTKKPIVVYIDRCIESIEAFMGVVYSGNFYVPIDNSLPEKRKKTIIDTLNPVMIICLEDEQLQMMSDARNIRLKDLKKSNINEEILNNIQKNQIDTDPLYAIFTSGSTGVPKGVLVSHRSVIDLIDNFAEVFQFSEKNIWGNQAPFDFDVSVKDIYSTIKLGGTMGIIPKKLFSLPFKLIEYLNENKINTAIWATSALVIIANLKTFDKIIPNYLCQVMFSGEVMPNKVLNYWRHYLSNIQYVNLYGPTEITCNCTYYIVDRKFANEDSLPIGKKFSNTDIILLDQNRQREVKKGEVGELCVRGSSLALGYYNNSDKTKEAFIQNPLNSCYPELIYCTGDLVKYNENDELMFLSRRDYQIKHMGHRIELGEIEVVVNAMEFIEAAVCIYDQVSEKIVLFYQAREDCKKTIVEGLQFVLPKYMWPNRFVRYDMLPLNKNNKIDRVRLKDTLKNSK